MSKDPKELLNQFKDTKVDEKDQGNFFNKMEKFFPVRYLKIMWHIIWHLDCAKKVFTAREIALIMAAIAYVISPLDAVPDTIPVIGLLDDATVIKFLIELLGEKFDEYEELCMN